MKQLLSALFVGILATGAFAQQEIQFTQFMNNKLYYNPGVAGTSGSICINAAHRTQWAGFENAPQTQNINAEIPIKFLHGALSVNIMNDQIGYFQDIKFGLGYSFNYQLGNGILGAGLSIDFINKNLTSGNWITPDQGPDVAIANFDVSDMSPELNFGVYYETEKFYAGISSRQLLAAVAELESTVQGGVSSFKGERNYFFMAGYNWLIPNTGIVLQPAILAKSDFKGPIQADINVSALYNNKIWGGVSYRVQDAIALMAGYYIFPELRLSYSYDLTTSALRNASSGSHEVMLSYCFKIEIPPREKGFYRNPRFL